VTTGIIFSSRDRVTTMEEAINRGVTFCAQNVLHAELKAYHRKLLNLQLIDMHDPNYSNFTELQLMDRGVCVAAIISHS
jgi:hypothetical protein